MNKLEHEIRMALREANKHMEYGLTNNDDMKNNFENEVGEWLNTVDESEMTEFAWKRVAAYFAGFITSQVYRCAFNDSADALREVIMTLLDLSCEEAPSIDEQIAQVDRDIEDAITDWLEEVTDMETFNEIMIQLKTERDRLFSIKEIQ